MTESMPGVVIAGGLSRRMGGGEKGLQPLAGKPLIGHVLDRLVKQAAPVAINANGDAARFGAFSVPVIPDLTPDHAGPLAGILAAMRWAADAAPGARFVITAACDTPFFPEDLTAKYLREANGSGVSVVFAKSCGRAHPVFGLWSLSLADGLANALASGTRKVLAWAESQPHRTIVFPPIQLGPHLVDPFLNANTPDGLAEAEALLRQATQPNPAWKRKI